MEDRITDGLYLELGDAEPDEYASGRAGALLAHGGVRRVSWWANCAPGRTELPMAVRDGTLLSVAEVEAGFAAPRPAPGFVGHHFVRYPRPNQGTVTGAPTTGLLVVWISPDEPASARRLRDWGDFVHIRHIAAAAVPGFTTITTYEHATGTGPRYMHFYELDADDTEAAYLAMARHMARYFGGSGTDEFRRWADWQGAGGQVEYCNTFRLLGALPGDGP